MHNLIVAVWLVERRHGLVQCECNSIVQTPIRWQATHRQHTSLSMGGWETFQSILQFGIFELWCAAAFTNCVECKPAFDCVMCMYYTRSLYLVSLGGVVDVLAACAPPPLPPSAPSALCAALWWITEATTAARLAAVGANSSPYPMCIGAAPISPGWK